MNNELVVINPIWGEIDMKYYKMILIILSILLIQSFYVIHNSAAKEFTYCYNKSKTGIDKLIDISGYYEIGYIFSII